MTINLKKGEQVSLTLSQFVIGIGWDIDIDSYNTIYQRIKRAISWVSNSSDIDFDIDVSVFILGENKKLLSNEYFMIYNNLQSPDGAVKNISCDTTPYPGCDIEEFLVDLSKINQNATEIVIVATIFDADKRCKNFGQVHNSFIRIYCPDNNEELLKYEVDEVFSIKTSIEIGRIFKCNGGWIFEAVSLGHRSGLEMYLNKYNN